MFERDRGKLESASTSRHQLTPIAEYYRRALPPLSRSPCVLYLDPEYRQSRSRRLLSTKRWAECLFAEEARPLRLVSSVYP